MDEAASAGIEFQLGGLMGKIEESAEEKARVAAAKKSAAEARTRELNRRAAHAAAVKRAQSESVIVHGPARS